NAGSTGLIYDCTCIVTQEVKMGFSKYKRGRVWWCKFYDPNTGESFPFSLEVKDETAAQLKISDYEKLWVLGQFNPATDVKDILYTVAVANYLDAKKEEGCRKNTLSTYSETLSMLGRTLPPKIALKAVSASSINKFLSSFKPVTAGKHYRQIKAFLIFCTDKQLIKTNPLLNINAPRTLQKLPKYAKPQQFEAFYSVIQNIPRRNLFETIALNGLRRNEANYIRWESIYEDTFTVTNYDAFSTKSGREKTLPILPRQKEIFAEQWELQKDNPSPYVFPNETGVPTSGHTITQSFDYYRERAGLPKGFNLKALRHMAGYLLAKNGVSLSVAAQILGHTNLSTTEIYSQLAANELAEAMQNIQNAIRK
ncbi:MAG TPA: tyrosine-type recombinase/integrase, partial [Patescibacteria group bacterium]|nr:tyrosine-type recombinase/integrase [Patescibacteria group bacterium]